MIMKVLLVDDDASIRRALGRALSMGGFDVVAAGSGEEACELLQVHEIDVALIDFLMPGMAGSTLYHIIATQWPHLASRVIMMTGEPEDYNQDPWFALHRLPVLRKPFELQDMRDLILQLTRNRRREVNEH